MRWIVACSYAQQHSRRDAKVASRSSAAVLSLQHKGREAQQQLLAGWFVSLYAGCAAVDTQQQCLLKFLTFLVQLMAC
jgi:hypothetical protein